MALTLAKSMIDYKETNISHKLLLTRQVSNIRLTFENDSLIYVNYQSHKYLKLFNKVGALVNILHL